MKIAVIGAGPGGIIFTQEILRLNPMAIVHIYDSHGSQGGLASGSRDFPEVEKFYHHIFKSDRYIRKLCKKNNLKVFWLKLPTSNFLTGSNFSSATSILALIKQLGLLGFLRLATGVTIAKLTPRSLWFGKPMAKFSRIVFGEKSTQAIWKPLLEQKFGKNWGEIDFTWLMSRIADRSVKLGFLERGYGELWKNILENLKRNPRLKVVSERIDFVEFDKTGVYLTSEISKQQRNYNYVFSSNGRLFDGQEAFRGVECLIVELVGKVELPFYWLNLLNSQTNYTVMINHSMALEKVGRIPTNTLIYLARYVDNSALGGSKESLKRKAFNDAKEDIRIISSSLNLATPVIANFEYNSSESAQPIFTRQNVIDSKTKKSLLEKEGVILSDLWCTYPHDRGQNYAISNAIKEAKKLNKLLKAEREDNPSPS